MLSRLLSLQTPAVIAHRGGSALRPENTMLAFAHAAALGAGAVECDVHFSRDREVVVIHDATLERTTDATGPVAARTADELARVDAGCRFGPAAGLPYRGAGAAIPRLTDLLLGLPAMPVIVEIKGEDPALASRVIALVRECGSAGRVIIGGFSRVVLDTVRREAPELATSASADEVRSAARRAYFRLGPKATGFRVFQVPLRLRGKRVLTPAFVRLARRGGYPVQVWVVDDAAEMRMLLDWGATGLISDRPDVALAVVGAAGIRLPAIS